MYKIHIFESVPPTINLAWKSKYSFNAIAYTIWLTIFYMIALLKNLN